MLADARAAGAAPALLGIRRGPRGAETESPIMRAKTGAVRTIRAWRDFARKPPLDDDPG